MKKNTNDKNEEKQGSFINANMAKEITTFIDHSEDLDDFRLPQRAYRIVRFAIRDLILPPGKTILEREMAEALQMSRTPVREALVRLEMEGMVRLVPRRGFIVEPIEREDLKEIYEIAETLDGLAVEMATSKIGNSELNKLEELMDKQEIALEQKELKEWAILDDQFHNNIIEYAGNQRLMAVMDSHSDQLYRARLFTVSHRPIPERSIVEHKAIISCMRAQESSAARILMQSHRKRARTEILKALEKLEAE